MACLAPGSVVPNDVRVHPKNIDVVEEQIAELKATVDQADVWAGVAWMREAADRARNAM